MSIPVFSLQGLIAWLETQPAETEYEYTNTSDCLLCRYFKARGVPVSYMGGVRWFDHTGNAHPLPDGLRAAPHAHTYGAALARAKALAKSEAA